MPSPRILFQEAYKADEEGDFLKAEKIYRQILKLDPKYSMAWNNLGWILYDQQQKYKEAEKCYKKSLRCDKNNFVAWNNLGILYYRQKKDYEKAKHAWKTAITLNPEFLKALSNLSVLYKFQLHDPEKSRELRNEMEKILEKLKNNKRIPEHHFVKCLECGNQFASDLRICDICGSENLQPNHP